MIILAKYNQALTIYFPLIKRGVVDFALNADYTHAAGDVKVSKDGGAAATANGTPAAITMGQTAMWSLALTAAELSAAYVVVTFGDTATKAIEDQMIVINTYGHASALHAMDLDDPVRGGLTALPNANAEAAGGLYTRGTGAGQVNQDANGRIDTNTAAMASGVVTATAIATDAIGAAELAASAVTEIRSLVSGTSVSGTTTTMVDAARTEADTDYWKGMIIVFTSGNISGQARLITGFNAATDTITYAPATTQAAATQTYEIWPAGRADIQLVLGSVINALISGRIDANTQALAADVITASIIANGAIDAATFAASAIDATAIATGAITAAKFAAGAIDAAAIATDAIGSAEFSQAAADKVWATTARTLTSITGIQKNVALANFEFFMRDSTDHVSGKTGLTVTGTVSIDGAAFGALTNSVSEVASGVYKVSLAAADVNGSVITLKFTATGADPTLITVVTLR